MRKKGHRRGRRDIIGEGGTPGGKEGNLWERRDTVTAGGSGNRSFSWLGKQGQHY